MGSKNRSEVMFEKRLRIFGLTSFSPVFAPSLQAGNELMAFLQVDSLLFCSDVRQYQPEGFTIS